MAAGHSDYHRGEMPVDAQEGTFEGFMGLTMYGGAALALIVIMPTLVFGVGLGWFSALIATFIVGALIGVALKLKAGWYVGLVGSAIVTAIICALFAAFM